MSSWSGRPTPSRRAIMIPQLKNEFDAVPKLELRLIGTVSSSILGPATENTPQQNPNKNLPITIIGKFKNIVNETATAAKTLNWMIAVRRPFWMSLPPVRLPATMPKMAAELMMVFHKIASSASQPNLTFITGAVWLLPDIANPAWIKPKPITNVNCNNDYMFASPILSVAFFI